MVSDEPMEAVDVIDPLDEVAHQVSDQTVRIAHLDEGLKDLNDMLSAGFAELRAAQGALAQQVLQVQQTQAVQAQPNEQAPSMSGVNERFDELDKHNRSLASRQRLLMLLLVLQLGLLCAVAASAFGYLKPGPAGGAVPLAATPSAALASPPPTVSPAPPIPAPAPDDAASAVKQKAKKHKH
jgi:hypothetical protein